MSTSQLNKKPPYLFILCAPSGGGKTTLCQRLLVEIGPQIQLSVSSTTRAPRKNEVHGREYFFIDRDTFQKKIIQKEFAEWAEVHGQYYGTSKEVIQKSLDAGRSVLLDIDVQGGRLLAQDFQGRCVRVFVMPPNLKELETRLKNRGTESDESIARRLSVAQSEMDASSECEHIIINHDLETAYQDLRKIVESYL